MYPSPLLRSNVDYNKFSMQLTKKMLIIKKLASVQLKSSLRLSELVAFLFMIAPSIKLKNNPSTKLAS